MSIFHRIHIIILFFSQLTVAFILNHERIWECDIFHKTVATTTTYSTQKSNQKMMFRIYEMKTNNNRFFLHATLVNSDDNFIEIGMENNVSFVETNIEKSIDPKIEKVKSGLDIPYSSAIIALRVYYNIHGNLLIPRRYVVPPFEEIGETCLMYPVEWHGVDLSSVYNMKWWQRHVKERPERVAELNQLGFVWGRLQPEWNIILEALISYYNIYGDVLVTQNFVVPIDNSSWTVTSWGMPLGKIVNRIRSRHDFFRGPEAADRRRQLDGLGFVWDRHEQQFQAFYNALRYFAFKNEMGPYSTTERIKPLRVPSSYVIPYNDDNWPREMWDYALGAKCTAVRQQGIYVKKSDSRQKLLEELGFRWSGNSMFGWLSVVHAAAIYSKLNNRRLDVPIDFYVPSPPSSTSPTLIEDWPWPSYLWGLPLGQRLKDIRVKEAYLTGKDRNDRIRQLEALGFIWKPKRGRPIKQKEISQDMTKL